MKNTEALEKLCEIVEKQLDKAVRELDNDPGKMPMQDAEYLDKLTHMLKSIKTTLAMEGYGSSERRGRDSMGRYTSRAEGEMSEWGYYPRRYAWDDGESYRGSYRSMDEGRSMHGEKEKIRRMMEETDDERVRNALRTAMQQM